MPHYPDCWRLNAYRLVVVFAITLFNTPATSRSQAPGDTTLTATSAASARHTVADSQASAVPLVVLSSQKGALRGQLARVFKAELAKAVADRRTPVVILGAEWCGTCEALEEALHDSSSMRAAFAGTYVIHIDVDEWPKSERTPLGLVSVDGGIPAVIAVDTVGHVIGQADISNMDQTNPIAGMARDIRRFFQTHRMFSDVVNQQRDASAIILHRDGTRLLFEIPRRTLETDLLVTCRVDSTERLPTTSRRSITFHNACQAPAAVDTVGLGLETRTYWHLTRVGHSLLIRLTDARFVPILRFGPDSAPIIDATPLLSHGTRASEVSIRRAILQPHGATVDVTQRVGSAVVVLHWEIVQLPNRSIPTGRAPYADALPTMHCGIRRVEKRDPWAARSEVVQPIVYTLDPATPPRWIPFIRRGLEEWNAAFDAMGFQGVLQLRELQGAARDSVWASLNDDHHDVISWRTNWQVRSAESNHFTGGDATCNSNVTPDAVLAYAPIRLTSLLVDIAASDNLTGSAIAFDPLVQHQPAGWDTHCPIDCPMPDSLIGLYLQGVVAHEIGHALGLDHNFTARLSYPTDSLRSAAFLHRMGYTATVMDYAWVNYVAQPEDHLPAAELLRRVGPYDQWALAWLYRPIPGAYALAEELPTLRQWSTAQDTAHYLRGSADLAFNGDLLGADPIQSAEYHLRLLAHLVTRFGTPGKHWPVRLWGDWVKEAGTKRDFTGDSAHVVSLVRFYMTHLALGHDPVLQAVGATEGAGSPGQEFSAWRARQTGLLASVLETVRSLLAAPDVRPQTRAALCAVLTSVRDTLNATPSVADDPVSRVHKDSARTQLNTLLNTLVADGECPPHV